MKRQLRTTLQASMMLGTLALLAMVFAPSAVAVTDGFGDGDRNNNGAITAYDTDVDLSGAIDGSEISVPLDAGDTGIIWASSNGFTSSNTGDPKANIKIIDDSVGDVDSPGLQSGYALGSEGKGSGSSFIGFFNDPVQLGPNVGDRVDFSFDWRAWTQSGNPSAATPSSEVRFGIFQDTDGEFGQSNNEGLDSGGGQASVVWGDDTGENDGSWKDAGGPGPIGDKGYWFRVPVGVISSAADARLIYELNNDRFLEGSSVGCPACGPGDQDTVASPGGDGPGGNITTTLAGHNIQLSMVRTSVFNDILLEGYIDGVLALQDEVKFSSDADVQYLGAPHDSFDYVAIRNTGAAGDFDQIIDNVSIVAVSIPEPSSLALVSLVCVMALGRNRRR